jgi:heme-degrading monooxygenase HmoA
MPEPLFLPPYYAVIFTATRTNIEEAEYHEMAEKMVSLAKEQPGYLGVESTRDAATGLGITVSYWRDEASIHAWKKHLSHSEARHSGRQRWYQDYAVRIARVEREYDFIIKQD